MLVEGLLVCYTSALDLQRALLYFLSSLHYDKLSTCRNLSLLIFLPNNVFLQVVQTFYPTKSAETVWTIYCMYANKQSSYYTFVQYKIII